MRDDTETRLRRLLHATTPDLLPQGDIAAGARSYARRAQRIRAVGAGAAVAAVTTIAVLLTGTSGSDRADRVPPSGQDSACIQAAGRGESDRAETGSAELLPMTDAYLCAVAYDANGALDEKDVVRYHLTAAELAQINDDFEVSGTAFGPVHACGLTTHVFVLVGMDESGREERLTTACPREWTLQGRATWTPDPATRDLLLERSGVAPISVVALGDSIIGGSGGDTVGTANEGFAEAAAQRLEQEQGMPVSVNSFADGSMTSTSLLGQLTNDDTTIAAVATSRLIVVTVGGNDSDPFASYPPGTCGEGTSPASCLATYAPDLESNFRQILDRISALKPTNALTIVTSPDYNPFVGWDAAPTATFGKDFYSGVATAETDFVCDLVDDYPLTRCLDFLRLVNGDAADRDAAKYLAPDHAHLGPEGVRVIAKELEVLVLQ